MKQNKYVQCTLKSLPAVRAERNFVQTVFVEYTNESIPAFGEVIFADSYTFSC